MTKNKFIAVILIILICSLMIFPTACVPRLSGTYVSTDSMIEHSFTFMEENQVEASAFGIDIKGSYVIEDGKIIITYSLLGLEYNWEKSFSKKGNSIFIDGEEFIKEN